MSSSAITLPASLQPPAPPPNALDETPGANPNESVVHYQLSSGHVASLPQSSVSALMKQDSGAKAIPSPADGQVLVQLSSGHTATLPTTSLPALKQQDPGFKFIAGDTTPLKTMTLSPDWLTKTENAVAGPNTAFGAPAPKPIQNEASGVSDIMHGDVAKGAKSIYDAEKPHVIQGSALEYLIQKVDSNFKGSVSPSQAAVDSARPTSQPLINVSDNIDKQTHPVEKAVAETAESLTSPENVAVLYGTGGLGLVESPQALALANRLLATGFSAAAIGNAYKNLKGFKEAYDAGDGPDAAYLLTHAVASGLLGAIAGADAAGVPVRNLENPFRAAADALKARRASAGVNPVDAAADTAVSKIANKANVPAGTAETLPSSGEHIQPALQGGIRTNVNLAAANNGLEFIPEDTNIRNVPKALGDQAFARSKATFDQAEKVTGIDFTALKNNIFKLDDQISDLAITDPEKAGKLAQQKLEYEQQAERGMQLAASKGVNVDQARNDWNIGLRADELSKHIRNSAEGTLANPVINPSKLAPRLQKMNEAEVGQETPKLTQLLGEDAASRMVAHAENARDALSTIDNFVGVPATDQAALRELITPTISTGRLGGVNVDWKGVLSAFDNLPTKEQFQRFENPGAVRNALRSQVRRQTLRGGALFIGKSMIPGAVAGEIVRQGIE